MAIGCAPTPPKAQSADEPALPPSSSDGPVAVAPPSATPPTGSETSSPPNLPAAAKKFAGVYIATLDGDLVSSRIELKPDGTFLTLTKFKDASLNTETTGIWREDKGNVVLSVRKANGRAVDPKLVADNKLKIVDGGKKLTDEVAGISYGRG